MVPRLPTVVASTVAALAALALGAELEVAAAVELA
jgi:hypothetical protein